MSYNIHLDSKRSLITVTFTGSVDDEEILRMMDELYQQPDYAEADQFIDFSQVKHYAITPKGMVTYNAVAEGRRERAPARQGRKIVLYAPDDLTYGMARLLATVASNSGIYLEVFRDLIQALEYVGEESLPAQSKKNA